MRVERIWLFGDAREASYRVSSKERRQVYGRRSQQRARVSERLRRIAAAPNQAGRGAVGAAKLGSGATLELETWRIRYGWSRPRAYVAWLARRDARSFV